MPSAQEQIQQFSMDDVPETVVVTICKVGANGAQTRTSTIVVECTDQERAAKVAREMMEVAFPGMAFSAKAELCKRWTLEDLEEWLKLCSKARGGE